MAGDSEQIAQDDIEKLLAQAKSPPAAAPQAPAKSAAPIDQPATLGQDEIEALLKQGAPSPASARPAARADAAPPRSGSIGDSSRGDTGGIAAGDIDFLFNQAERALASIQSADSMPPGVAPFKFIDFAGAPASTENATLDLLRDVELDLKIELGRTHMYLEDVLKLNKGAVVPLDRLAGDPVDIYVNGRLIARGEVLILNDNFCVRVAELIAGESAVA
jgi:flagellar motor switch protein FliN/FliY